MDRAKILESYDRHERREASIPGLRREEASRIVRMVDPEGEQSYVAYSALDESSADGAIRGEIARFEALGQGFEWKLYSHDRPADLKLRLEAAGFAIGEEEAVMALDLAGLPEALKAPSSLDIRRVTGPSGLADLAAVHGEVWEEDSSPYVSGLAMQLREHPEFTSVYVAYAEGKPVCAARIEFSPRSPFASLWGGSTLEEYRGRGIYTALLALRAREAIQRGYSFLTIDASPMSRPIAERRGFRLLAMSRPCTYGSRRP